MLKAFVLDSTIEQMGRKIERWFDAPDNSERFVRLEVAAESFDPAIWLRKQPFAQKLFWSDRADVVEIAGVGEADRLVSKSFDPSILTAIAQSGMRYLGGMRFDAEAAIDEMWRPYSGMQFWLPRFELVTDGMTTQFACHVCVDDDVDAILAELQTIRFDRAYQNGHVPHPMTRFDVPDERRWADNISAVLGEFEAGTADKVVLARRVVVPADEPLDPMLVLQKLKAVTPNSFHFCLQLDENRAFVGASPERLYRREGDVLESEALAGTRKRGETAADDQALAHELLNSDKERHEQRLVLETVCRHFESLCDGESIVTDGETQVLKLAQLQHLYNRVRGALQAGVTDAEIITALHPTPAVGGSPRDVALRLIAELEPFDRGWYTGAVGWMGGDAAEFAVGIRCALVDGEQLVAFSGAGIVPGSTAAAEWAEIENKLLNFRRALIDN